MVKQRIKKDGFPVIFNEMLEKAEPIRWENSTDRWMKIKLEDLGVRAISGRRHSQRARKVFRSTVREGFSWSKTLIRSESQDVLQERKEEAETRVESVGGER